MAEKKKFKQDLFEQDDQVEKKQTLFDIDVEEAYIRSNFNEKQLKKMRLLDQEYRLLFDQIPTMRKKLNYQNRRIQLACAIKLFAQATIVDQDAQDEVVEIGEKCSVVLSYFKDNNTFYRSFIIQYIFKLIYNEKDIQDCTKAIFKFLKRVESLNKFDCTYPAEFMRFQENDLKCFLQSFILRIYILKLRGIAPTLEKVIKIYNDQPEVDAAAIIICKNLLSIKFTKLLTHETYKFLIDDNQIRIVPQILSQFDEQANQTIIALFVEEFKCNMIIMNDERAEQPEYFIPQTKKPLYEDIYIYKSQEGYYYSIFEKKYSLKYLEFCLKEGNLYQQDQKDLADKLLKSNLKLIEDRVKEQRKWMERVTQMEQTNKEMKAKQDDVLPLLACCECERELSDLVPLLKFDVYYFCEACILDMIARLIRDDKQFTYIGQTQVKRFQLRDAITELNNERERLKLLKIQEKSKKKNNNPAKSTTIGFKETQELIQKHATNQTSEKLEQKWQDMQTVCIKCNDDQCYQEELYLLKEVKTHRQIAVCMSCLVFLNEQVQFTYRNIFLHKSFEISNEQIKETYREFARYHLEKTKQTCLRCMKIKLYNYVIQPGTKSKELKIICKQCFIDIFQYDEKLKLFQINDILKEQILDQFFHSDFKDNICVSCDKKGLKTLTIENISNYAYSLKDDSKKQNSESAKDSNKQSMNDLSKKSNSRIELGGNDKLSNKNEESDEEDEDDESQKRVSKICIDCIFLNIGRCKNPLMDYLIRYVKLKTNIVYKYNQQIKTLLENDARKKMQQLLMTCAMCLRKLKDLYEMNDQDQRICISCFLQYRSEFQLNQGHYDGYLCDLKHQEIIFVQILAFLVDITQCIGCKEKIKSFDYEVIKLNQSYSNVILCDNCIKEQLVTVNQDLRRNYEIKSAYFNNEVMVLQNKKEVNVKIQQFQALQKKSNFDHKHQYDDNDDENESPLNTNNGSQNLLDQKNIKSSQSGIPPRQRQHITNKNYSVKCFNKTCREVELSEKNRTELRFIKMPKCQCIFCIHCFTSFYFKLAEARYKKQVASNKQNSINDKLYQGGGDNKNKNNQNQINGDEVERFCPSMLCSSKYSEYQIKELANGYQIKLEEEDDDDEKDLEIKRNKIIEEENVKKYQNQTVACSVCNKENRLLVIMNDDFFVQNRKQNEKKAVDYNRMNDYFLQEKENDFLEEIVGFCECLYSCKPCLFQIYYKDRCIRCLKKPSSHIYRQLFSFKNSMQCSQCLQNKFIPLEDGPLLTRTNNRFQCVNCKKKYEIE